MIWLYLPNEIKKTSEETLKYTTESFAKWIENLYNHFPQIDAKMWKIFYHESFFFHIV